MSAAAFTRALCALSRVQVRLLSIRKNTAYNLLGSGIPLVVSLVSIPIYMRLIGETRYGVLAIAWLLLGYFGCWTSAWGGRRHSASPRSGMLQPANAREETFWTALTMNVGLGIVGGLLIWPIASYFSGECFQGRRRAAPGNTIRCSLADPCCSYGNSQRRVEWNAPGSGTIS